MAKNSDLSVFERALEDFDDFTEAVKSGRVGEQYTRHDYVVDLKPGEYSPERVRETRAMLRASQTIFAQFLGVSVRTVRAWEQNQKTPSDMACRFMDEIRGDPGHALDRLRAAIKPRASTGT